VWFGRLCDVVVFGLRGAVVGNQFGLTTVYKGSQFSKACIFKIPYMYFTLFAFTKGWVR
jgi:hypothetical protein